MEDESLLTNLETLNTSFEEMFILITTLKKNISTVNAKMKNLEKQVKNTNKKYKKQIQKYSEKKTKKPSGFAQACKISKQLSEFMNLPEDSEVARTDVTKYINCYIKENNLQSDKDKSRIVPDDKLKELLKTKDDDVVTFFTIQKFMNKHFIKK